VHNAVTNFVFVCRPISETVGIPSKSELLWGRDHIKERLLNLELEITPVTYFRINSAAAEVLCRSVAELANVDQETTLLDLFCGSGSLALTLASVRIHYFKYLLLESVIRRHFLPQFLSVVEM
jgi:tRNA (uracil-5-)-methyltransferase